MTSVGISASSSNDYWKGTDYIERKLGSVLDHRVASSTKQVLLDRIQFKEATKPDPFYTDLKNKYVPLNGSSNKQQNGGQKVTIANRNKGLEGGNNKSKDELPAPKYILFEREKIELKWRNVRRVGPGLSNLGNTCFLNSVIQVLTYTPPLVNYLATQEHSSTCQSIGFCMLCELQRHVLRTFGHNQNEAIKPMAILQKLKYIAKHLRFGHQEDSHEFLRYVIDGMLKSCLCEVPEKLDSYTKGTTMVHQVFGGYFRSQVTCERCHNTSNTYDPLMEILLDIKHAHSVIKALQRLVNIESLNGDNMYLCPRCKRKVPAKKHLTVHKPPNVMTMCLKRFDCHSLFGTKLNKEVNYPEHLNLRPFMSKTQGPEVNYKLYAVLVHSGYSCNSGHYFSFIKASNGAWYQMNDSTVRQVNLKTVLSQQAYLLFYIRDQKTLKEKPCQVQQPVKAVSVNGVKTWKTESFNGKQNTPKVINEPKKVDNVIGQPVLRKPEPFVKLNNPSNNKPFKPVPTSLTLTREKISFTLNHGPTQKKITSSLPEEKKENAGNSDEPEKPVLETPSLAAAESDEQEKKPCSENTIQVNDITSSVENKLGKDNEDSTTQDEAAVTENLQGKDEKKLSQASQANQTNDVHATTKWKVTTNTPPSPSLVSLLSGGPLGTKRERTPSLSSDVSNACSIASKTGEWAVSDRSSTQDVVPRLPERQHAGWKVSAVEDAVPKKEDEEREKTAEKIDEEVQEKEAKKRKHSQEKAEKSKMRKTDDKTKLHSEESRERLEESRERSEESREKSEESREKSGKSREKSEESREKSEESRKKSEESREKSGESRERSEASLEMSEESRERSKESREKSEESREKSGESRERSEDDEEEKGEEENLKSQKKVKKEKKKKKKKKKEKRRKSLSPSRDTEPNSETEKHERHKKEHKKSKKSKKKRRRHNSETSGSQDGELELSSKSDKTNYSIATITQKTKDIVNKVMKKGDTEIKRPLVQYSDHSSSNEETTGNMKSNKGSSRSDPEDRHDTRNNSTMSSEEIPCSRSQDSSERKRVVDVLLEQSRGTTNYGCEVARWDGEKVEVCVKREQAGRKRRDEWDDEYDRGKVKRTKQRDGFFNRSYHGENLFQREHDRRRIKQNDGWHHSKSFSSSSSRWHNRSADRYSRRDRK